jgi:hypothetical protein
MPIKDYSTTAANNTLTPPNGAPEGMAAGLVNNTMRQLMADTRLFYEGGGWCDLGHVPTYVSATSFTIPTDVTAYYTVGRRIRVYGTIMGTFYGYIVSSAYSSPNTTVTVVLDSGALTSNLSRVDLSFLEENATLSKDYITNVLGITNGFANMFRNPFMEVAQRGTSGTNTAGVGSYTLDGWAVLPTGANISWQQAGAVTIGSTYSTTSLGLLGASGLTGCTVYQRIESAMAAQIAGKRVTVQFVISNQTGAPLTPTISTYYPTATDNHTSVVSDLGVTSLQTIASGATATVSYTFVTNSLGSRGYGFDLNFGSQLNGGGKNVYISAADIRVTPDAPLGLNNAPPRPEYRPRGPEALLCQRYYEAGNGWGYNYSPGSGNYRAIMYPFKVNKRTDPSVTISNASYGGAGANTLVVELVTSTMFGARVSTTSAGSFVCEFNFQATSEL